jgi:hypothetical protein
LAYNSNGNRPLLLQWERKSCGNKGKTQKLIALRRLLKIGGFEGLEKEIFVGTRM